MGLTSQMPTKPTAEELAARLERALDVNNSRMKEIMEQRSYIRKLKGEIRMLQIRLREANRACEVRTICWYEASRKNHELQEAINRLTPKEPQ